MQKLATKGLDDKNFFLLDPNKISSVCVCVCVWV
jgi:hypothetical protein